MHTELIGRLLAEFDELLVELGAGLGDQFFHSAWMNPAVGDQCLEGAARHLAADRVEARDADGVGRVIDDHIDASRQLERANVCAPLAR